MALNPGNGWLISHDDPATNDTDAARGNLPVALTRLIGREEALGELRSLLWQSRLLTLCGPGGAGKTRLALALAESVRADFVDGAWWVDLSDTTDPALLPQVLAASVLPGESAPDSALVAIARRFSESSLLVIDNCEQVIEGARALVAELLGRTPSLKVIATSRQTLGVPGEQVWRVSGLAIGPGERSDASAAELFAERAREASSSFDPSAQGVREAIARICSALDGMPLAIELAAARVPVLGVVQIADRLESDSAFLRNPSGSAPARHRTLQGTLAWSYEMLEAPEQRLFRRLGAFRGSFSLAAVEAVCGGEPLTADEVLDLLSTLVDRSLVQVVDLPEQPRYRLLATIRQYAVAQLEASGELEAVQRRHTEHFLALAEETQLELAAGDQLRSLERLELEHDNLDEALAWLQAHRAEEAGRLASLLWPYWYQRGYYREASKWFDRVLASDRELSPAVRADALLKAGEAAFLQCDYPLAIAHLGRALEAFGELEDERATATALQRLGSIAREQGRYGEARELHHRSLEIWQGIGDARGIAETNDYLGFVAWLAGDFALAESLCGDALAEFRRSRRTQQAAGALVNLGAAALYRGELELARQRLREALDIARILGFQEGIAWSLHELAIVARRERRPVQERASMLRDALFIHHQLGDRWRVASVLEEIAGSLLAREDSRGAAQLFASAEALRDALGAPVPPAELTDNRAALSRLARQLGSTAMSSARSEGRRWELDQALETASSATEWFSRDATASDRPTVAPILTARELAVLRLLADGQTNREIASELYISPSTAGVHVSNILRKIGAKRRVDAASLAHTLGLLTPV